MANGAVTSLMVPVFYFKNTPLFFILTYLYSASIVSRLNHPSHEFVRICADPTPYYTTVQIFSWLINP
jgi:hypothetical protein